MAQNAAVKFGQSYNGFAPSTIFSVDPTTKTLSPFSSGQAYTDSGYQLGQEKLSDPGSFAGFSIGSPIQSKSDQLDAAKTQLNDFQTSQFQSDQDTNKRQASQYDDEIAAAQQEADDEAKQFQTLRDSLNSQDNVSLEDEFKTLSDSQGVPGINDQLNATKSAEGSLEGDLRTVSGDAGVEPESVFQANLAQKQQPLLLKEQTLTDRLNAANDYIKQALSLKQSDQQASADKLDKAITLVGDSISATQNRLSNLNTLRSGVQDKINQGQSTAQATINTLISTGALSKLAPNDLNTLELESGMPAGTLASIAKSVQPQAKVIGTETDDYGNISVISQNPDGSVTAHIVPGAAGKTAAGGSPTSEADAHVAAFNAYDSIFTEGSKADKLPSNGSDGYANPATYNALRADAISKGYSANDFDSQFKSYVNPADPQDYNGVGGKK